MSTYSSRRVSWRTFLSLAAGFSGSLGLVLPSARAQPGASAAPFQLETAFSHSADGDADYAKRNQGEVGVNLFSAKLTYSKPLSETLILGGGIAYEHIDIDATAGIPLPDRLRSVAAELSATWIFDRAWSATLIVQPGFYSDGSSLDGDSFNSPGLLLTSWRINEKFTLLGGLRFNSFSENPVLPFLGVRWKPSQPWTLVVGVPRTEVAYQFDERGSVFAGFSFQGGAYHVENSQVNAPAGYPSLRDTELDYREIRVGAGVRYPLAENLRIEAEIGTTLDRRFEYDDRNLDVKIDNALFLRIGVNARF